jgi:hypothetical protein
MKVGWWVVVMYSRGQVRNVGDLGQLRKVRGEGLEQGLVLHDQRQASLASLRFDTTHATRHTHHRTRHTTRNWAEKNMKLN